MFSASTKSGKNSGLTPDPKFNYVTILLHGDGTNGAQNNTFIDSSTNNFIITRNGNTTQGSFSPYGSNWSNYFNETPNNYLSVANNAALNMGTGDFTVEAWINLSNVDFRCIVCLGRYNNGGGILRITNSGNLQWYWNDASFIVTSSTTVTVGTWNHVAVVRSSGTTKLYINGTNSGSASDSNNYSSTYPTWVGAENQGSVASQFFGYISNVRVVKGTAVYTSNFTPSTTPLTAISGTSLLTCQSNRFIDNSSNAFSITTSGTPSVQRFNPFGASTAYSTSVIGGSGYFDGSGAEYLEFTQQTYSGNFTMECWVYQIASSSSYAMLFSVGGANTQLMIDYSGTGKITFYYNSTAISSASGVFIRNQWNHIAYVRSGSTITIYYNGTSVASGTLSDAIPVSLFGGYASSGYTLNGYMSDVRITTSALYTTTFTPPTAPLTAISGTSILLNMTNGAIYDNAMMNDLETVGNAQISTSVVKYGTGSLKFDGTGDYLKTQYSPNTQLGAGNFTIEFWIYFNSVAANQEPLAGYDQNSVNWGFYLLSSGTLNYYLSSNGGTWDIASGVSVGSVSTGQWYHVALVRNGSTFTPYLNGVAGTTATSSLAIYSNSQGVYIGGLPSGYEFNGYFDDIRITKGYARYTANFTPPTAAFSNTGPI